MGRGSSKLSAVGGTATVTQRRGASFSTSDAVDAINAARENGSRSEIREAIEGIREGQSVTLYNAGMHGTSELKNVAENPVTWTKGDQYWRSSDGRAKSDQEMTREIYNASYNRKLVAGEISTESRVEVTGRPGKDYDGIRFAKGTYDIYANRDRSGPKKWSQSGSITTYNGTQYGVAKAATGGGYTVTHIPTGMSTGRTITGGLAAVAEHIKEIDKKVHDERFRAAAKDFKNMIRGD